MPPAERHDQWQGVRNILVIRLDNLGDMVMLSPALRTLKQAFPGARLTLMASPNGSQMAPLLPWVEEVMVHKAVWQDLGGAITQSRERELELVDMLQDKGFDAAFIFTSFSQSPWPPAYVCHLAGIPRRLGQSREFGGSLLTHWVKPLPDEIHQVDRNLHLLEQAGFEAAGRHMELAVPGDIQVAADQQLTALGLAPTEPFIAVSPGASCPSRRYDARRFAEAALALRGETGLPLVVLGSEREMASAQPMLQANDPGIVSLVGRTSVPEMAAVIGRSRLLVASHSGPMHIADALDRPMVILFAGTEYESQWRPRRAPAILLRRPTSCSPCYGFTCPHAMECLDIPPREVVRSALRLLDTPHEPRKESLQYEAT